VYTVHTVQRRRSEPALPLLFSMYIYMFIKCRLVDQFASLILSHGRTSALRTIAPFSTFLRIMIISGASGYSTQGPEARARSVDMSPISGEIKNARSTTGTLRPDFKLTLRIHAEAVGLVSNFSSRSLCCEKVSVTCCAAARSV